MSGNKDPNEKPSFFDSFDESKSWPPANGYEIEDDQDEDDSSLFEEENPTEEKIELENPINSDDYLDQLIDHIDEKTNINNMRIIDEDEDDDDSAIKENPVQEKIAQDDFDLDDLVEKEDEDESFKEINQEDFLTTNIDAELDTGNDLETIFPSPENLTTDSEESEDYNYNSDFAAELEAEFKSGKGNKTNKLVFEDDLEPLHTSELEESPETEEEEEDPETYQDNYLQEEAELSSSINDNFADDDFMDMIDGDDHENEVEKPFRTFTKINLAEELAEEKEEEEAAGLFTGMNKNIIIILAILVLSIGYFIFSTFFNKQLDIKTRERRRPTVKERIQSRVEQVTLPVWEISDQEIIKPEVEDNYAKSLVKFTGRENPFAMPQSVIDALKRQADQALLAKIKPNTYKRLAYRATLLGVLTSEGSTIALVNVQEATFDVIEGTSKPKILKLATKTMDKAKLNTLEMGEGSFIGPWQIVSIATPKGLFSDAKITVEFQGSQKVLSMGKAEDLGIFDPTGQIDDLESSTGNEFEADDE